MAETIETQVAVLGAGPGGYPAAFLAADKGKKVALIDGSPRPGGTCLYVGCIPSKAVLHAAKLITDAREAARVGLTFGPPKIDLNGVRGHWQKVVNTLTGNLATLAKRRNIAYFQGRGRFTDPHTIQVENGPTVRFEQAVIATGSVPTRPPALALPTPRVMDSTGALKLEDVPARLLVVGGGYIGLELGYVYAALGSKVTVVEMTDGLLPGVDRDLVRPLEKRLQGLFEKIYLSTKVVRLEETPRGIRAHLEGEAVAEKATVFDRVLVAVGRRPSSQDLGLEKAGVAVDEKGFIRVDTQRRSSVPHLFAIGDVAGEPMLAHKATYEGKVAAEVIAGENAAYDARAVPAVVFTDPEVAWCGLTEVEAKKQGREVRAVKFPWAGSGRAMTLGRTEGLTKLVVDAESDRVLGVGVVGVEAGEMIAEAMLAIEMGATARDLGMTMHAHPTLAETVMEAAEHVYGLPTHALPPRGDRVAR
jgi:dihydrolipoamide dehydrogenase